MVVTWPGWRQWVVSVLVIGLGLFGAQALHQIDQDLRIMYTEYTLAATDLAHISADVMRYRATIIRALEAQTKEEFLRFTQSLPEQRARIEQSVDRYAATSEKLLGGHQAELASLAAMRKSLEAYFLTATRTMQLLTQLWDAPTEALAIQIRTKAEIHAAEEAGGKLIRVTQALDQLMDSVTNVAKELRSQGSKAIRATSFILIAGSLLLAYLNLVFAGRRGSAHQPAATSGPGPEEVRDSALARGSG